MAEMHRWIGGHQGLAIEAVVNNGQWNVLMCLSKRFRFVRSPVMIQPALLRLL